MGKRENLLNKETMRLETEYMRSLNRVYKGVVSDILAYLAAFYDNGLPPSMADGAMFAAMGERAQNEYKSKADYYFMKAARLGVDFVGSETVKNAAREDRAWREFIDDKEAVRVLKARQGYCGNFYSLVLHDDNLLEAILTELKKGDFGANQIKSRKFREFFEEQQPEKAKAFENLLDGAGAEFALRRIARTEMWTARSQGTAVKALQNVEESGVPRIMRFSCIESEVLCDYCRPRDNLFFNAEDSPEYWEMIPPIHYNCRCTVTVVGPTVLRLYHVDEKRLNNDSEKINHLQPFDWGGHGLGRDSRAPVP